MEWIINNKEWLFSGIGVVVLTGIISLLIKNIKGKQKDYQIINSGDKSTNIQGGKDVKVTLGEKNDG